MDATKVANHKTTNLIQWWGEVKKIAGIALATGMVDIRSQVHLDNVNNESPQAIADLINTALLEHLQEYHPLKSLPSCDPDSEVIILSVPDVSSALSGLNPHKALVWMACLIGSLGSMQTSWLNQCANFEFFICQTKAPFTVEVC